MLRVEDVAGAEGPLGLERLTDSGDMLQLVEDGSSVVVDPTSRWSVGGVEDATTRANRVGGQSSEDQRVWVSTEHIREKDAGRLRSLMREEVRA